MHYHFIGIGGIGISGLAGYLLENNNTVTGSDLVINENTEALRKKGAIIYNGHNCCGIDDADFVIVSKAINSDNAEIIEAKKLNIPIISREELLGRIVNTYSYNIAVAGMHGKTTATAMLITIFNKANLNPSYFLGGILSDTNTNYSCGSKNICIAEACEYKKSFLKLNPQVSIILNIDLDHTDCYNNLDEVIKAYNEFACCLKENGSLIVCDNCAQYINKKYITFGESENSDFRAENIIGIKGMYQFDVTYKGKNLAHIALNAYGRHNVMNALAAFIVAYNYGVDIAIIEKALNEYNGVKRRMSVFYKDNRIYIEDYAHHPMQVRAVIDAVKNMGYKKIGVFFEPHTYTRTKTLMKEFQSCFDGIKAVTLLPVYAAREPYLEGGTSHDLMDNILLYGNVPIVRYAENYNEAYQLITDDMVKCDINLILGAGDIYKLADMIRKGI